MGKKIFSLFFFILFVSYVSAQISISETKSVYNFGEKIIVTLTINPQKVEGNFDFSLICGEQKETIILYKAAENYFEAGKEVKLNSVINLEKDYIGNLSGDCYLKVMLGNIAASSSSFKIVSDLNVNAKLDKEFYDPGESIVLDLEAYKLDGTKFNGFVKGDGIFNFEKAITDGKFKEVFSTQKNLEAGEYELNLFVYDKGKNGDVLNFKNLTLKFKINQIPYSVPLTLSSLEINPGDELDFEVNLYDQSGKTMKGEINVEFISPDKKTIIKKVVESGSKDVIKTETNFSYGVWILASSFGKLREERDITIKKLPLLNFEFIENSSVISIRNVGNVEYVGPVSFDISNQTVNLSLNIKPGEERKFTLSAPTGEHDVKIKGGDVEIEKRLLLTGRVVEVKDYKRFLIFSQYPFVWGFIAFLIIALGIVSFFKYKNKNRELKEPKSLKFGDLEKQQESFVNQNRRFGNASFSLVLKGEREQSTIVLVKIKNKIKPYLEEILKKLIEEINKYNAAFEFKEDSLFVIFSPRKTKSFKNEYNAIKFAYELCFALRELNKKFRDKIDFGIGISDGDIISSLEKGNLLYTFVDNTPNIAKKLANISNEEVLISEKVKNKLLREVRTEKLEKEGFVFYKIINILDKEKNEEKLKELLKRINYSE